MPSAILRTLLAAALAISGVTAGPCKATTTPTPLPNTQDLSCHEGGSRKRYSREIEPAICSRFFHLANQAYLIRGLEGYTRSQCAAFCYLTDGCTMITTDNDNHCRLWRGTTYEAGILYKRNAIGEFPSELSRFTCGYIEIRVE